MIDSGMKSQLVTVFEALESEISFHLDASEHPKQSELNDLLTSVAETSSKLHVVQSPNQSEVPSFEIVKGKDPVGIRFVGIPGGHEFTSLILAILNSDGKGKLPDTLFLTRIKQLNGPLHLRTFMSLSCENCPDVVQSLNIMAMTHPDITHEVIDGEYQQDEVIRLGIQGVPAVFHEDTLISSGKAALPDLLERLEAHAGRDESTQEAQDLGDYDVVVAGGGPAGVSAAIYVARKGLKTAIIADKIGGQMLETKGIENMITIPYTEGPQLSAALATHAEAYDIDQYLNRRIVSVDDSKQLTLSTGETLRTRALVVATGAKWRELNVPGEKDFLGKGVAYCPHCDGPFYKGKSVIVVGGGNSGVEAAIDLAGIVKDVTVLEFAESLKADQVLVDKLNALPNSSVITSAKTVEVSGDTHATGLRYEDRESGDIKQLDTDGIFVQIGLLPNSQWIVDKVECNTYGEIIINDKCKTSSDWIYAAGDVTTVPYKQIIISMGEGAKAGLSVFEDLVLN